MDGEALIARDDVGGGGVARPLGDEVWFGDVGERLCPSGSRSRNLRRSPPAASTLIGPRR